MSDSYIKEAEILIENVGKSGRYQIYSSIFMVGYSLVCFYSVTLVPLQKIRPEAECIQKNQIPKKYETCSPENYCDPNYEKRIISSENYMKNWYSEFGIDCDTESSFDFLISCVFFADLLTMIFLSSLPDIFGRKKILLIQTYGLISVLLISFFISGIKIMTLIWFFYEIFNYIFYLFYVYSSEIMSQKYFSFVCSLINIAFPVTGILNTILFYNFRDWRINHVIITFIAITCGILFKLIAVESPKYSVHKLDTQTLVISLKKIASINGTLNSCEKDLDAFLKKFSHLENKIVRYSVSDEEANASLFQILKNDKNMLKHFLIVTLAFVTVHLIFFGVLLNIEKFDNNVILISIILYSSEIIGELSSGYLAQKYGRIKVLTISFYLCGISFFIFEFLTQIFYLKLIFCFLGNLGISSCFNVIIIYISEIFDVKIKSVACSYSRIPAKLSVMISPYLMSYLTYPFILLGILSILTGYLMNECRETLVIENKNIKPRANSLKDYLMNENS